MSFIGSASTEGLTGQSEDPLRSGIRGALPPDHGAGLADLGLRLDEAKQLTAALQAEMVAGQLAVVGERQRGCATCERPLASKGYYPATFRSLFGDVPVRVRRLLVCPCQGPGAPKSFAALDLGAGLAPELAYVTAKFAALAPFGKVAALLSELLPISGAQNAGTVRNRTLRVGQASLLVTLETGDLCLRGHAGLQLRHQLHTPHQLRHQPTLFP